MSVTVEDLTADYQQKIDNIKSMISAIPAELQKPFRVAMNIYDVKQKARHADEYIGHGMKALGLLGWYFDGETKTWLNTGAPIETEEQYRSLYGEKYRNFVGVPVWEIIEADVDITAIQNAGEMQDSFDIGLQIIGGEQDASEIKIPDIPISPKANLAEMTKGDDSPDKFIYAYSDGGISKNKRNWRPIIMESIANQVMELLPPGHYGHMKPQDVGFEMPMPVVTWIGATTEDLPDANKRLWLKGYIIPLDDGNSLKTYIRAKAVDSISVWGTLTLLPNEETGVADVLDIDLKSIDISGKLKEGLHSGIVKTAGEMQEGDNPPEVTQLENPAENDEQNQKGGTTTMDKNEVIRGLTMQDIQSGNPGLFDAMRQNIMDSMNVEAKNRQMIAAAGEMQTIEQMTGKTGADATAAVKSYQSFAGEMEAVLGMNAGSPFADILNAAKAAVEKSGVVDKVSSILKPKEGQNIEARATELAEADRLAQNTAAIQSVKDKFTELTADVQNDVIREMIGDRFAPILEVNPADIPDGFAQKAIADMTAQMPAVKQKVLERANSLMQTGRAAGEMAMFDNLGVGKGAAGQPDTSKMSDEEYVKYLGYSG